MCRLLDANPPSAQTSRIFNVHTGNDNVVFNTTGSTFTFTEPLISPRRTGGKQDTD